MRIYLAGKVHKNCWRHGLVDGLRGAWPEEGQECPDFEEGGRADVGWHPYWSAVNDSRLEWPVLTNAIFGEHDYVGPFFVSDDHGCYHRRSSHGVLATQGVIRDDDKRHNTLAAAGFVVSACLNALNLADLVFAWVESEDCYGTIFELGYAVSRGLPVAMAGPCEGRNIWFCRSACRGPHFQKPESLEECLREAIRYAEPGWLRRLAREDYSAYLRTRHWRDLRAKVIANAGGRCGICNRPESLHAHHRTYERVGIELESDLIALCSSCHATFHGKERHRR